MRARLGWWLRRLADRIDYPHAPKAIGYSFTFEEGIGIVFHERRGAEKRGCPLWYLQDSDYERAHTEAINRV